MESQTILLVCTEHVDLMIENCSFPDASKTVCSHCFWWIVTGDVTKIKVCKNYDQFNAQSLRLGLKMY